MAKAYSIGLDIGGTKIKGVLVDQDLDIIREYQLPTLADQKKEDTINNIVSVAKKLMEPGLRGVGVSLAGRTDDEGKITFNPNIPKLVGTNIKQILQKTLKTPVRIENDAACFAFAEHRLGAGKGTKNMVGLIIGTGIGAGIIINGQLFKGKGTAGEVGHMIIDPSGMECGCGKRGDLESWCSGKGITKRYIAAEGKIEYPDPAKIFSSDEPIAQRIANETIEKLAVGIANMCEILDPELVVLGGGVSNIQFHSKIQDEANKLSRAKIKIAKARSISSGAIAASLLVDLGKL